jgi:RNA polymerase sigma-70 factor (ECF subfamily)
MKRSNQVWLDDLNSDGRRQTAALSDLRTQLLKGLGRYLNSASIDNVEVEDLAQDSLIKIISSLQSFEGRSAFVTWAMAISIRETLSHFRRKKWASVSLESISKLGKEFASTAASVEIQVDFRQRLTRVSDLMAMHLTKKQRLALVAELKGMPQEVIARQLGSNRNAIYKLTHDARKRLKTEVLKSLDTSEVTYESHIY